jgi:hypothetical protein
MPPPVPRRPGSTLAQVAFLLLNIAWIFSLVAFLAVLAIASAGMFAMMPSIGQGIGGIRQGETTDSGFDPSSAWTFNWSTPIGATGALQPSGGNPGGYAETQLEGRPGSIVSGYWSQGFRTEGSHPFLAAVRLDYRVFQASDILGNVTIALYVDTFPGPPLLGQEVWKVTLAQTTDWTPAGAAYPPTGETLDFIDVSSVVTEERAYYVKVAALAWNLPGGPGTPTIVGIDNVRLVWETNAFIVFYVIAPVPILLGFTQSPIAFYAWTATLVAATVACLVVLGFRDRRTLWAALATSSDHMPAKLRSRSATVAIMQTFLAVIFLSIVIAILSDAQEPAFFQEAPGWYILFSLVNAPVYEELVFRVLMIGAPLVAGSLYFRARDLLRGRVPGGTTKGRYLAGSLRYLVGGGMSRGTSRAILLPAFLFLLMSSIVFGLAHAPGYGDWKVFPVTVAGLAMGYLFLRHGLHAAILFHFATDVFIATYMWVGSGSALGIAMNLGFFFLAFPGAGFFAYYVLYAVRLARDVVWPAGPRAPSMASPFGAPSPAASAWGPYPQGYPGAAAPPGPPPTPVPAGYVPAVRPPGYGMSPVEYRCPRCAWVEAAYEAGRFRCLRCGHVA